MKRAPLWTWCTAAGLLLIGAEASSAVEPSFSNNNRDLLRLKGELAAERAARVPAEAPRGGDGDFIALPGDSFETAIPVPSLPFLGTGNTCDYTDDYTSDSCGHATGPDVVYSYSPAVNQTVSFSLCGSSDFDTQITLFEDTPDNEIDCNDDYCSLKSYIHCRELRAGHTYYIVVDGFESDCGNYQLAILICGGCDSFCSQGDQVEGEISCFDEYVDDYNGGCNFFPPVFTPVECQGGAATICGTAGTYTHLGLSYRDTDWYEICVDEPTVVRACVTADFLSTVGIINPGPVDPCAFDFNLVSAESACETLCVEYDVLEPGTYWVFVATSGFSGVACGSPYTLTIDGCFPCEPCDAEQPILALGNVQTVDYTWPLWEVQVRLANTGGGPAYSINAEIGSDLAWLQIPDPTCYYGALGPGDHEYGVPPDSSYVFDLTDWPGGSFNAWFDITYTDSCGDGHLVHLDPDFLDPEQATGVTAGGAPIAATRLLPARPTPFNPQTTISFEISRATYGELSIFNVSGQLVRELWKGELASGQHSFVWSGRDDGGNSVPSGTYLYRLRTDDFTDTKRMVLIR
jgi:hypothetical protein